MNIKNIIREEIKKILFEKNHQYGYKKGKPEVDHFTHAIEREKKIAARWMDWVKIKPEAIVSRLSSESRESKKVRLNPREFQKYWGSFQRPNEELDSYLKIAKWLRGQIVNDSNEPEIQWNLTDFEGANDLVQIRLDWLREQHWALNELEKIAPPQKEEDFGDIPW